jgi:hypothetical protein
MSINEDPSYDAFASARLLDSIRLLKERESLFQVTGHKHTAYQDLSGGGWIEEQITITWRPKQVVNGVSHDNGSQARA